MSLIKRFPSYDQILRGAINSAARFPFTLLSALVGVTAAIILVEPGRSDDPGILARLLVCGALGLPLFTALTILAEKKGFALGRKLMLQLVGLALLIAYFFTLPDKLDEPMHHLIRFALLNVGLHFLVAWLPWTGKDQIVGFWQYNKTLFLRFLISALYSAVLFLGLVLALAAVDHLFGAEIKDTTYVRLWFIIAGLFNTWVFLAGVPKDLDALNRSSEYPNGLKVFTQFILLPLVGLYFVILIAYEAKIIVTWNWPKGWVSELVLWYAVIGILSLLLLHPLRDRIESRWIQAISKWYYLALVPLVAMLFLAIMRRINDYGVTELRYFVFAMAVGLAIVVIYMIVSKRKDVRLIPIVICLIAFFSAFGPWSAFAVSRTCQQDRLEALMVKNSILVVGAIQKPAVEPSVEDRREMSSAVVYLNELHGMDAFSAWLPDSTLQVLDTLPQYGRDEQITEKLGFGYVSPAATIDRGGFRPLRISDQQSIDIRGYNLMFPFDDLSASDSVRIFFYEQDTCRLEFDTTYGRLTLQFRGVSYDTGAVAVISLRDRLSALVEKRKTEELSPQDLSFNAVGADTSVTVVLRSMWIVGDSLEIRSLNGYLLLRRPQ